MSADGQYVHISALVGALAARGHRVFIAGPDDFGAPRPRALDAAAGNNKLRARLPRVLHEAGELIYSERAYSKLRAAAKAASPDMLYERYNLFYHAGARLAKARRLPYLLEVNAPLAEERAAHGGLALKGAARLSERAIWRAADKVLPVTGALARMVEAAGVSPEKIAVVRNGVDAAFLAGTDGGPIRARYGLEGKTILGFAGFVRPWHGVDRALRYLAARRERGLHLLIVGDGDAVEALKREAETLGLSGCVTITGTVQREAMPAHVAAFDIALQPAATDYASPLKLFEYMALARAIVAPSSPNIREVLENGRDAALFPPADEAAFFQRLDALAGDAEMRARLGAAARAKLLRENLTWAGNAARVEAIAEKLLERR